MNHHERMIGRVLSMQHPLRLLIVWVLFTFSCRLNIGSLYYNVMETDDA